MNYYISDLHLFHKNVTRAGKDFDDRPFDNLEEMHSIVKDKMNNVDFFNRRSGEEVLRAYNVGCMMPYMDYEPKSLAGIARGAESIDRLN